MCDDDFKEKTLLKSLFISSIVIKFCLNPTTILFCRYYNNTRNKKIILIKYLDKFFDIFIMVYKNKKETTYIFFVIVFALRI